MVSSFMWLDHSEHERRRMLDVLDLFREKDTQDQLGLGGIRDALADQLFPGTSTVQTRARYFLLVPWMYQALERRTFEPGQASDFAKRDELALIDVLAASADAQGTIGIDARKNLKRPASNVYWGGLQRLGICRFRGSQPEYHRWLESRAPLASRALITDDREPIDDMPATAWHAYLPSAPRTFPRDVSLALTAEEAAYLHQRVSAAAPGSLFHVMIEAGVKADRSRFPWEHPAVANLPEAVAETLRFARGFSDLMLPPALLYNLMLAESLQNSDLVEEYRKSITDWSAHLVAREGDLATWSLERFWRIVERAGAAITLSTRQFVQAWLDLVPIRAVSGLAQSAAARQLIDDRERRLKGPRARLTNRRALEMWGGASGAAPISYRWIRAQRIIQDIVTGLTGG